MPETENSKLGDSGQLNVFRRNVVNKISITALALLTAFSLNCSKEKEHPEQQELTIVSFIGDVSVTSKEGTAPAKSGQKISEGDIIKAGVLSSADISIGKDGVARISEKTTLVVESIAKSGGTGSSMKLDNGRFSVVLSKLSKNEGFAVKTSHAVAAVRGTGFRVSAENGSAKIEVVSGKVQVSPVKDGKSIDSAAVIVEKNTFVSIDEKKVAAAEKGDPIKVEAIPAADLKSISDEMKKLPVAPNADESLKEELNSIVEPAEEKKEVKEDKAADAAKKDAALRKVNEQEKELKEKEDAEKLAVAQKEAAEKSAAEKEAKVVQEKKEKKEARVKNIPTI